MRGPFADTLLLALVLTILGLGLLLLLHVGTIEQQVKSIMDIVIELDDDISPDDQGQVTQLLTSDSRVVAGSVEVLPKEEAIAMMGGDEVDVSLLRDNPFSDLVTFNLHAEDYTDATIASLEESLLALDGVAMVSAQSAASADISDFVKKIAWMILGLGLVVSWLAAMLLHASATMRLSKDRKRIETMQLVGARQAYIERPYLRTAVMQALAASAIATIVLVAISMGVQFTLYSLVIWSKIAVVALCLLLISLAHGVVTNKRIIDRYLRF